MHTNDVRVGASTSKSSRLSFSLKRMQSLKEKMIIAEDKLARAAVAEASVFVPVSTFDVIINEHFSIELDNPHVCPTNCCFGNHAALAGAALFCRGQVFMHLIYDNQVEASISLDCQNR